MAFLQHRSHPSTDPCAIVGIGATEFSRDSGRSVCSLAAEASLRAVADAGLEPSDIDGLVRSDYDTVQHNDLAHWLGLTNVHFWGIAGTGGASPCAMIGQAVAAILSGQATNVLVYRALNGRSGLRYGRGTGIQRARGARVGGGGSLDEYFLPYGLMAPGQLFAMYARRHLIEHGSTLDGLAAIALTVRERANANPAAVMHKRRLSRADYDEARMIAEPLRVFDYCLETDGACAVVVTTTERARHAPQPTVTIRAVAQASVADVQGGTVLPALMRPTLFPTPAKAVADELYRRAGIGPGDVDVAQFYDCFTITVLLQLEDYGFCRPGEGGEFASSGALGLDGTLPINTAGGNLSEGYIHGMNHVVEGVRQMRGQSTSQVEGAQTCLVTSGAPTVTSGMVLRAAA